jgi:hypothetical protein
MMERIKTALITSYSGAVLVGWILAQGVTSAVGTLLFPVMQLVNRQYISRQGSVLGGSRIEINLFDPAQLAVGALRAALTLSIGLVLLRWLYFPDKSMVANDAREPEMEPPEE